jgi:DNA-binding NarL/FixJ family response regulator
MRVIIADDVKKFRDRQVQELRELGVEVVAEAASGDELLFWVRRFRPDAVLLDINFSNHRGDWDTAGISAAVRLRDLYADLAIVMLSNLLSQAYLDLITAIDGGVAYLGKETCGDGATIIQALHQAISGKKFIDPALTNRMMSAPRMQPILWFPDKTATRGARLRSARLLQ